MVDESWPGRFWSRCSSGKPVSLELRYAVGCWCLGLREADYCCPFPRLLSVFNWGDQIQLSFEPTTCCTPPHPPQLHLSGKGRGRGKRQGHRTNLFLQVSDVYFPGSSTEDFCGRFPAVAEFGDVGGDVRVSGPLSSRTESGNMK